MSGNKRTFKRRRITRRGKGKKSINFTSASGAGQTIGFRARKINPSRWRRLLWDASSMSTHYRSSAAATTSVNTPASQSSMTLGTQEAMRFLGAQFYTAGGGAIPPDSTDPIPAFTGRFIIRGGKIGIRLTNTFDTLVASQNSLQGTVFLIKTSNNFQPAGLPATVPVGWDPTVFTDFNTIIGRIVYRKTFLLRDADSANIEYRLKVSKLDEADYLNVLNQYVWMVLVGNVDISAARSFAITYYYNLSFTADGTT